MKKIFKYDHAILVTAMLLPIAFAASGCGGGGGGGGSASSNNDVVKGTVTTTDGSPIAGDLIRFDGLAQVATTTTSTGSYSLTVPIADITRNDQLDVYDPSGELVDNVPVTLSASGSQTVTVPIVIPVPPPPP